ncbi:MAG: M23 family metallopeptidase [Actinomycetes bacterium]
MYLLALALAAQAWLSPVPGALIEQRFDPPAHAWGTGHRGLDFQAQPATEVFAIGKGVVTFVGEVAGKPVIVINHPGLGLRSTYEPVIAIVELGQEVLAGTPIGETTETGGHCGGHCLHLGLKGPGKNDYRDPLPLIDHAYVVLKPSAP